PRLRDRPRWARYGAALGFVVAIAGARTALTPLLGTQAPLLPLIFGVFVAAYVGGLGPALLALLVTPLWATVWFTKWPNGTPSLRWGAHVMFFIVIGALVSLLMHELQLAYARQLKALREAEASARESRDSAAQLRLVTDHLPILISYLDREEIFRFANAAYREWLDRDPSDPPTPLHEVFGEAMYAERQPYVQAALRGELVRFEGTTPHARLGSRACEITYVPERAPEGAVRGFYVMAQDITERRLAEESLRERERLLKLI